MGRRRMSGPLIERWFRHPSAPTVSLYRSFLRRLLVYRFRCQRWWRERVVCRRDPMTQLTRRLRGVRRVGPWTVVFYGPMPAQQNADWTGYWLASVCGKYRRSRITFRAKGKVDRTEESDWIEAVSPTGNVHDYISVVSVVNGGVGRLKPGGRYEPQPTAISGFGPKNQLACDLFYEEA